MSIVACVFAIFAWWFATGMILLVVRWADRTGGRAHVLVTLAALPMVIAGFGCVALSLADASVRGVYLGFAGALMVWGWVELAFLTGVVAGPMQDDAIALPRGAAFQRAFATVAYHELALVLGMLAMVVMSGGAENRVALATYLVLFLARIGAKLNLFYGVPRINTEFVPRKLQHLKSYFTKGPVTVAFPVAITVLTILVVVCVARLVHAQTDAGVVGFALLTALSALALLEHWLMVVPLPDAKLWRWMLPAPRLTHEEERVQDGL